MKERLKNIFSVSVFLFIFIYLSYIKCIHGLSFREKKENSLFQLSKNVFLCSRNLSFLSLFLLFLFYISPTVKDKGHEKQTIDKHFFHRRTV